MRTEEEIEEEIKDMEEQLDLSLDDMFMNDKFNPYIYTCYHLIKKLKWVLEDA